MRAAAASPFARPTLRGGRRHADSAILVLHGGQESSHRVTSRWQTSYIRMFDMYAGLRHGSRNCAVYLLRYSVRGWNAHAGQPAPVGDTLWALDQISRRHAGSPIAVLGHSLGGRTAFAVAGHSAVAAVCALAPWLPEGEPLPAARPGQRFVIAHGTADTMTSAPSSLAYAERLRLAGGAVASFELPGGRHALVDRPWRWHRFAVGTTLGLVGDRPLAPMLTDALRSDDPATLRLPL